MRPTLLIIALTALLTACAHVGVWNDGYPKHGHGMTAAEKKAEFDRFAIRGYGARGDDEWVKVGDGPVALRSFYPVLSAVSPRAAAATQLGEIQKLYNADLMKSIYGARSPEAITAQLY
jgi:hypothetical protein